MEANSPTHPSNRRPEFQPRAQSHTTNGFRSSDETFANPRQASTGYTRRSSECVDVLLGFAKSRLCPDAEESQVAQSGSSLCLSSARQSSPRKEQRTISFARLSGTILVSVRILAREHLPFLPFRPCQDSEQPLGRFDPTEGVKRVLFPPRNVAGIMPTLIRPPPAHGCTLEFGQVDVQPGCG